jgi:hypothetical protein
MSWLRAGGEFAQERSVLLEHIEAVAGKDARESLEIRAEQLTPSGQMRWLGEMLEFYRKEEKTRQSRHSTAPTAPAPTAPAPSTSMRSRPMNPTALAITGGNTMSQYAVALG